MDRYHTNNQRHSGSGAGVTEASRLTVRWAHSVDDIPDALWQACFPAPLEGRFWYAAMEKGRLEDQFKFHYAIVFEGDEPIALAPTFFMDVPIEVVAPDIVSKVLRVLSKVWPRAGYQRTLFVGSPCSDEGYVGLVPGVKFADVVPALHQAVEYVAKLSGAVMVVWKDFRTEFSPALESLRREKGLFKVVSFPGTEMHFPRGGVEDYIKTLKKSRRQNITKKLKTSKQLGDIAVTCVQNPDNQTLEEIYALFWETYLRGKSKFEVLGLPFFAEIARAKESWFILLRNADSGKLMAFKLCFRVGDRIINKFIGLDYSLDRNWFIYFRLWEAAVDWSMRSGAREAQTGQTGYAAKLEVGHRLVPLNSYCRHFNPLIHALFARLSEDISWQSLDSDLACYMDAHPEMALVMNE